MLSRLAKFLILSSLMAVIEILADLLERVERRDDFQNPGDSIRTLLMGTLRETERHVR
jgi:hypothetical protein